MKRSTKVMAYAGTIMVCLPILLTLLTAIVGSIAAKQLRLDYLMPAELFLLALVGALLLLWAAIRTKAYQRAIAWSLAIMVTALFACQGLAVLTGLASGDTEPAGWPLFIVNACLALYTAAIIAECIWGFLLLREIRSDHSGGGSI